MTIDDREFAIGIPKRRSVLSHYTISPDDRQSALSSQEREPSRLCVLLVATDCSLSDSVRSAVRRDGDCSPSFRRRVFATARELASDALRDTAGGGVGVVARSSPAGGAEAKAGERSPFTKYVSIRPFPYASIARATHVSERSAAQQMDRSERPGTAYADYVLRVRREARAHFDFDVAAFFEREASRSAASQSAGGRVARVHSHRYTGNTRTRAVH